MVLRDRHEHGIVSRGWVFGLTVIEYDAYAMRGTALESAPGIAGLHHQGGQAAFQGSAGEEVCPGAVLAASAGTGDGAPNLALRTG